MKILKQLTIISGICLAGEVISKLLPFAFPSSVLSMLIVLALLCFRVLKENHINEVGNFLLANMSFFFIPVASSIIKEYASVKSSILALIIIAFISTIITFFVTYYTVVFISKVTGGRK